MVAAFFFLMKRGNGRGGKPTANTNTVHAGRVDDKQLALYYAKFTFTSSNLQLKPPVC